MKKNQMPQIGLPADACERSGFTDKDNLLLPTDEFKRCSVPFSLGVAQLIDEKYSRIGKA